MKKIISLILAMMLALQIIVFAEDTQFITRGIAVEKIVRRIYDEGGNEPFPINELYCLHESGYVHFVPNDPGASYPILCEINKNIDGSEFLDVPSENKEAIFITLAKKMDIISGYDDNLFCPDNNITYNEAVKMLICGLGYGDRVFYNGGYPNGYIALAKELGIINSPDFTGDKKVNIHEFNSMLESTFEIQGYPMRKVMMYFTLPKTPEECINTYAKAVQERNGAVQYALIDDERQAEINESFKDLMWATGASSPWVTGFEAYKSNDLNYAIVFHYATSTGPEPDQTITVELKQLNGIYKIANMRVSE